METLTVQLETHEKDKNDDSGTGSGTFELSPRKKLDAEHPPQPLTPSSQIKSDDESQTNDDENTAGAASSASTMPLSNSRKQNGSGAGNGSGKPSTQTNSKKSNDFDSIEILDNKPKLSSTDLDSIDGSMFNYSTSSEKRLRKKNELEEEKDEKCVTCLYYTCLCCDCTIS